MKFKLKKIFNFIKQLVFIASISSICAFFIWFKQIVPQAFQLGEKSSVQLINKTEKQITNITESKEQELKVRKEAFKKFLEAPQYVRNKQQADNSLEQLNLFINRFERFLLFIQNKGDAFLLQKRSYKILLLLPEEELSIFFKYKKEPFKIPRKSLRKIAEEIEQKGVQSEIFRDIKNLREDLKKDGLSELFTSDISRLSSDDINLEEWKSLEPKLKLIAQELLNAGYIGFIDEERVKSVSKALSLETELNDREIVLISDILKIALIPNLNFKTERLNRLEEEALETIDPILIKIPANTIILKKGEVITQKKLDLINQLNLNKKTFNKEEFNKAFWMTLIFVLAFCLYVNFEKYSLNLRQILLLSSLMISASAFVGFIASPYPALVPLAGVAMTTGLFFRPSVGFPAGILFGILCYQALGVSSTSLVPAFTGVIVGTMLCQNARNRADLTYSGIWLALAQSLAYLFIVLISEQTVFELPALALHAVSGLGTALIISSGMPFGESIFGVMTRFRLLELSDSNQPLLKRLHDEAPGTYEHTLVVADLAQDAAKSIGADRELTRVGILYHDIGKLHNPQMFIENQFGGENPHEKLTPHESAREIIKHVIVGIEMAKKHRLPEPIRVFIPAHQGDARAGHFFLKACQQDPNLSDDNAFRYPGPKPNSKETGIAMLADTVEATIRSLKTGDKELVIKTIQNLIDARIKDKQLENSTLTEKELEKIALSFFASWKNKNHERIKYAV